MRLMSTVVRGVMLLCVALGATACAGLRPTLALSEPTLIEVPGPVRYVPVPDALTAETPAPLAPVPLCVDAGGGAVLCNRQLDAWREQYSDALASCNGDKAAIDTLPLEPPK